MMWTSFCALFQWRGLKFTNHNEKPQGSPSHEQNFCKRSVVPFPFVIELNHTLTDASVPVFFLKSFSFPNHRLSFPPFLFFHMS